MCPLVYLGRASGGSYPLRQKRPRAVVRKGIERLGSLPKVTWQVNVEARV